MTPACRCVRFWLDDDDVRPRDLIEAEERAGHLLACPACRDALKALVAQREDVRGAYPSDDVPPALSEALVGRCVDAMTRAAATSAPPEEPAA